MRSPRNVIITGAISAVVFGGIMTLIRMLPGSSTLTWVFAGLGFGFLVNILLVVFIERMREGRQHAQALAIGAVVGGALIALIPVNDIASQLLFGVAGTLAAYSSLIRWATNAGEAAHNSRYRALTNITYLLPPEERLPVAAIPSSYRQANGTASPYLVTLWLNEQFYGNEYPEHEDIWRARQNIGKVPYRDISRKPETIDDWRNLALIVRAAMQDGETPTLATLRSKIEAVFRVRRPLDASVQLLGVAGYSEGLRLLTSDMPDEYLEALSV